MQPGLILQRIGWYLNYRIHAKSIQYIHSPFLFELMQPVFNDRDSHAVFQNIESLRNFYLNSTETISVNDLGAGSVKDGFKADRRLKDIASSALQKQEYARFLYRLAKYTGARKIVEMGTSLGITSQYLALAAGKEGEVVTLEGSTQIALKAEEGFHKNNCSNIRVVKGNFEDTLEGVLKENSPVDFLFIDGNHLSDAVLHYFDQSLPYLHSSSVVVIDDIHWSPDMKKGWQQLTGHESVTLSFEIFQFGVLFLNPDLSRQNFVLKY